jgi:dolichyl-phosphate-mannose-protein mannosyltransferase
LSGCPTSTSHPANSIPRRSPTSLIHLFFSSLPDRSCRFFITHFTKFGFPSSVVFDECHFGPFVHSYYDNEYLFDVHAPLDKQLLSVGAILNVYQFKEVYSTIGAPLSLGQIRRLRFWPCVAGALRPPLRFLAFNALGSSPWWSLAFALCVAMDQALVVQSRLVLLESFLLLFAALTILLTAILARAFSHGFRLRIWTRFPRAGILLKSGPLSADASVELCDPRRP